VVIIGNVQYKLLPLTNFFFVPEKMRLTDYVPGATTAPVAAIVTNFTIMVTLTEVILCDPKVTLQ